MSYDPCWWHIVLTWVLCAGCFVLGMLFASWARGDDDDLPPPPYGGVA